MTATPYGPTTIPSADESLSSSAIGSKPSRSVSSTASDSGSISGQPEPVAREVRHPRAAAAVPDPDTVWEPLGVSDARAVEQV